MAYLKSDKIKVFPSAYRGKDIDVESFLTTEENLNNISNKLTFKDSYIVDYNEETKEMVLVLGGYLFKISSMQDIFDYADSHDWNNIFASIKVEDLDSSYTSGEDVSIKIPTLVSCGVSADVNHILDIKNEFTGLYFSNKDETSSHASYSLELFNKRYPQAPFVLNKDSFRNIESKQIEDSISHESINEEFNVNTIRNLYNIQPAEYALTFLRPEHSDRLQIYLDDLNQIEFTTRSLNYLKNIGLITSSEITSGGTDYSYTIAGSEVNPKYKTTSSTKKVALEGDTITLGSTAIPIMGDAVRKVEGIDDLTASNIYATNLITRYQLESKYIRASDHLVLGDTSNAFIKMSRGSKTRNSYVISSKGLLDVYLDDIDDFKFSLLEGESNSKSFNNIINKNGKILTLGDSAYQLKLEGSELKPMYKDKKIALEEDLDNYLPLTGGEMTGFITMGGCTYSFTNITCASVSILDWNLIKGITLGDNVPLFLEGSELRPTYNKHEIALEEDLDNYLPLTGGVIDGELKIRDEKGEGYFSIIDSNHMYFNFSSAIANTNSGIEVGDIGRPLILNGNSLRPSYYEGKNIKYLALYDDASSKLSLDGGTLTNSLHITNDEDSTTTTYTSKGVFFGETTVATVSSRGIELGDVDKQLILNGGTIRPVFDNGSDFDAIALESDLSLYLPLSGGTLTNDITILDSENHIGTYSSNYIEYGGLNIISLESSSSGAYILIGDGLPLKFDGPLLERPTYNDDEMALLKDTQVYSHRISVSFLDSTSAQIARFFKFTLLGYSKKPEEITKIEDALNKNFVCTSGYVKPNNPSRGKYINTIDEVSLVGTNIVVKHYSPTSERLVTDELNYNDLSAHSLYNFSINDTVQLI